MEAWHITGTGGSPMTGNVLDIQTHDSIENTAILPAIFREFTDIWITSFSGESNGYPSKAVKRRGHLRHSVVFELKTHDSYLAVNTNATISIDVLDPKEYR